MAVVAIAGDDLVALADRHLHADDDGFLADVEVTEAADEAHAVHLAGALLEAADEEHLREGVEFLLARQVRRFGRDVVVGAVGTRRFSRAATATAGSAA